MLLNVGLRTDIAAHYSEWLFNRIRAGFVYSRNPLFPYKVTEYSLDPAKVDALLFCSKDYAPLLPRLWEITDKYRTLFHFTVNLYGPDLEPHTPDLPVRLRTLRDLAARLGKDRLFWRYDPIVFTKKYTAEFHLEAFSLLAEKISPYVAGCITNFVEMNNVLHHTADVAAATPTPSEKRKVMAGIGECAKKFRLPVRICGRGEDYSEYGIGRGGCVTLADIARANGCRFRDVRARGNRRGCDCIQSRDIGWYDSCPSGCLYCNVNRDPEILLANLPKHDPNSPLLIGELQPNDLLLKSPQESFLAGSDGQLSLFDL